MSFDPYHQWLGIPPEKQPPDLYQLLGIRRFEENPTVISHAAERQLLMLKSMQNGPHAALTQKLMNEITNARIRLLDTQKKARYDAAFQRQLKAREATPPPQPPSPELPSAELPNPLPPEPTGAPLIAEPPASPAKPRPMRENQGFPDRKRRRGKGVSATQIAVWVTAGLVAAVGLTLAVLLWPPGERGLSQEAITKRNPARGGEPKDTPDAQSRTKLSVEPATVPARPRDEPAVDRSDAGGQLPLNPSEKDQIAAGDVSTPPLPREMSGNGATLSGTLPSEPGSDPDGASVSGTAVDDPTGATELAVGVEEDADPLSQLPNQLNLLGTVTATGDNYVFVGKLASPAESTWRISIDDYISPPGQARFTVGTVSSDQNLLRWPLHRTALDAAQPGRPTDGTDSQKILARIEASATELSLWISEPENEELINDLSRCSLILEAGASRHHVQLAVNQRIPPLLLAFDKARQMITLDQLPNVEEMPPERVLLEIVQVDQSSAGVWEGTGRRAAYDEESKVPLKGDLQCELSIKLTKSAEQYGISVLPRFIHNDRRQPLVPNTITREIARAKSQLNRNQRDLVEAQNSLRVLPREISRVRGMVPRNPAEVASKQVQLSRLVGMADSMQSRIRRLAKVIPEQTAAIAHMERVQTYASTLSDRVTLLVRIYARGQSQDYLLLDTGAGS